MTENQSKLEEMATEMMEFGLQELSHGIWGDKLPNTYIDGTDPIGGV